ncbi:hypothetical protein AB3G45_24295 [Shinella sp. S4-D37]|uniref:hypothetical protein n=1 Tax=Shinella sp. S4-D37 TaxID=3161999 RepID=UPI0034652574
MGRDFWNSLPTIGKTFDDMISWPFRAIFGGGMPLPHYEPTMARADVGEVLTKAREKAAASVHVFDPSGIETVRKFCKAKKDDRYDMDISAVLAESRALLLSMSGDELQALGKASPGQIKRFLDGKRHGIDGVPVVGVHAPYPANDRSPRSSLDYRRWKAEAHLKRNIEDRFKLG